MKTQITAFFMAWGMFLSIPCPAKIWDEKARPWQLVYLPLGLSVVLGFIGVKLIMEALHGNSLPFINGGQPIAWVPEVPTWLSLAVIVVAIGGAALASVLKMRAIEAKEK